MDLLNGHSGRVNAVQWVHRHDCGESAEGGGWMEPPDRPLLRGEVCLGTFIPDLLRSSRELSSHVIMTQA